MGKYTPWSGWEQNLDLDAFMDNVCMEIESEAKTLCPWKTGNLRRSISWYKKGDVWVVWASAKYAIFIELGTKFMNAQPFLRPALERVIHSMRGAV